MLYTWNFSRVRLFGRWDRNGNAASTVNTGSTIEFCFRGTGCVLLFDTTTCCQPYPHVWVEVDGVSVETPVEEYVHVRAADGVHRVKVTVKSAVETQHRWYAPLEAVVRFTGIEADRLEELPEDTRPIIEFVGDSITEGILIEPDRKYPGARHPWQSEARVYQDDVCLDYSYLAAKQLGMRCRVIGFGAVGSIRGGSGCVPAATVSYPYVYDGVRAEEEKADVIVVNHGANDAWSTAQEYTSHAVELLRVIRRENPAARLVYLTAFCGVYPEELKCAIAAYEKETGDRVDVIDSKGWVPKEPLHPLGGGHRIIAEHLVEELGKIL